MGEAAAGKKPSHVHPDLLAAGAEASFVPSSWFEDDPDTQGDFIHAMAEYCLDRKWDLDLWNWEPQEQELGDQELKKEARRIRINQVDPQGLNSVLVTFDVLPVGYTEEHSTKSQREDVRTTRPKDFYSRRSTFCNPATANEPEGHKGKMSKRDLKSMDAAVGLKIRERLETEFGTKERPDCGQRHEMYGLRLETVVDLKELKDGARFMRAVYMLAATVLYYPVIQATLPIIHCAEYKLDSLWDANLGDWVPDDKMVRLNATQAKTRLNNDMSQLCGTPEHVVSFMIALIVLGCCFALPFVAMFQIKHAKKQNRELLDQQDRREGREVVEKKKVGLCRNLFMGEHQPLTKRREAAFEARILRDSYSALYAMCEQRAYKWFVMDLFRKAIVTAIYTFGKDGQYDYMYVLLIFFSIFAINHDITQPYRGRTENLFGFLTLMFIIILIHTATVVNSKDSGSYRFTDPFRDVLPMVIAMLVLLLSLIVFLASFYYVGQAKKQDGKDTESQRRSAQDKWGFVARNILQLTPASTEDDMKAAFEMLANSGEGDGDDGDEEEEDEDDDGQIDLKELKAFRDDDRRLNGKGVPEFIHQTDDRFAGLSEEQRNHPDTKRLGGYKETADDKDYAKLYQRHVIELKENAVPEVQRKDCLYGFKATDEEIDAMALEADKDGEGKIDYDEFVAVICKSWERAEQTERLSKWLYANYVRIEPLDKKFKDTQIPIFQSGKEESCFGLRRSRPKGLYEKYLETGGPEGELLPPAVAGSSLIKNRLKFCGLLNSLGEQSFSEDQDMTNRASLQRKKQGFSARKFGTEDNRVLRGLEEYDGGEEKAGQDHQLEQTSSKSKGGQTRKQKRQEERESRRSSMPGESPLAAEAGSGEDMEDGETQALVPDLKGVETKPRP